MENGEPYIGCFGLVMFGILVFAIWRSAKDQNRRWAAEAEQARIEGAEKFRPYTEAWSAARTSSKLDTVVQCGDYLVKAARLWQPHLLESVSWDFYQELLLRLKENPQLKPIVLEAGRVAYSTRRPRALLTIYDEQAIQNDILAHSG
jgi:hypothetical protein